MTKLPISVLVVARNEEANIAECLSGCDFASELIVIDDFSTDRTVEIAEQLGARVWQRSLDGNWGAQKSFAISKATCPWILLLDADERITPELAEQIRRAVPDAGAPAAAYTIERHNRCFGQEVHYGVLCPDRVLRLMPREGARVEGLVHEAVISPFPVKPLGGFMMHNTYADWESYFGKFNKYTTLCAQKYFEEGKKSAFVKDILIRPALAFFKMYVLKRGFLDGRIGLVLSLNHGFYTMTKYVKLATLNRRKKRG